MTEQQAPVMLAVTPDHVVPVDVYVTGVLADAKRIWGAIRYRQFGYVRMTLRNRNTWRGWRRRNHWHGYHAEPCNENLPFTRCGVGWTKRRALADLRRHMAAAIRELEA